ncbi:uncharacterized protein LOC131629141 [Vicia villosa]|uniref:uncharacterized protein LOC131629141 n=1 Tax=Vicia villosa TaxID=3911 RepID=UPI00273C90B9|nr:uncharacterized protein LOC131629141 [Vicia villosa]
MAGEDKIKEKASKTRKLKHIKISTPHMASHDAPPHMTSHDAPPHMTSHDAPPHMTSHDAPPRTTSHDAPPHMTSLGALPHVTHPSKTLHFASPHSISHVAPSSSTSHVRPVCRASLTKKSNGLPHTPTSATMTSNGPHPCVAPPIRESATRTSNVPPSHVSSAVRTSNVPLSHDVSTTRTSNVPLPRVTSAVMTSNVPVSHATSATRTSNVPLPHVASATRTSNVPHSHVASATRISNVLIPHASSATRTSNITPPSSIRGVASPSISQPYDSDGAQTPRSSETVVPSETQSSGGKQTLYLDLQGFLPLYAAASGIRDIIWSNYSMPWNSWKKIHIDTRDLWFGEFKFFMLSIQKKYNFVPPDDAWARKNFEKRGAAIMKNNLNKVRVTRKRPTWINLNLWNTLCEHWGTSGYKKKSIQAKTNRASDCEGFGMPLHTCGSISTSQHRANLTEMNGIPPTPSDLFVHTHQHRKNKTWVDRRSEHVYENYKRRWEELTQQESSQGTPPPKEIDVWTEVARIRKGHVYGLGSESSLFASRRNYRGSSSSSTEWVQRHEFEELKIEREEMKIEREEMRKERDELRDALK